MKKFLADTYVAEAFAPNTDLRASSNSPRESDWVDLSDWDSATAIIQAIADADAESVTVSWRQATSNTGAGNKALVDSDEQWYVSEHATALPGTFAEGATLTGNAKNVAVSEITADQLDVTNGYRFVAVRVSRAAANGKIASGVIVLRGGRYQQALDHQPSALA